MRLAEKRKEVLGAEADTADSTELPTAEDIESDASSFGLDEDGEYVNCWGCTDHMDIPIRLTAADFVRVSGDYPE